MQGGKKTKKVTEYYLGKSQLVLDAVERLRDGKTSKPAPASARPRTAQLNRNEHDD